MNEPITISFPYIITIAITSGLLAGIVGTIGNLIVARINNKSQSKLEQTKYRNSINDYRYKVLHEYLDSLCNLPSKNYAVQSKEEMLELVHKSNDEYETALSIFQKSAPLLDEGLRNSVLVAQKIVESESGKLVKQVFTSEKNDGVQDLILFRDEYKKKLIEALQNQIARAFIESTK